MGSMETTIRLGSPSRVQMVELIVTREVKDEEGNPVCQPDPRGSLHQPHLLGSLGELYQTPGKAVNDPGNKIPSSHQDSHGP